MRIRLYEVQLTLVPYGSDEYRTRRFVVIGTSADDANNRVRRFTNDTSKNVHIVSLAAMEHVNDDLMVIGVDEVKDGP